MATFEDVDLRLEAGGGALVDLTRPFGDSSAIVDADPRGEVVIPAGAQCAIVRGIVCTGFDEAVAVARDLTRGAIRELGIEESLGVAPDATDRPLIAWWTTSAGITIRIVGAASWTPGAPRRRAGGRLGFQAGLSYPAQGTPWSEALQQYRSAEACGEADVDAAHAHLYFALTTVLRARVPAFGAESEKGWLLRALRVAGREVDLSPYAPAHSAKSPPEAIRDELYGDVRRASQQHRHEWRDLLPTARGTHGDIETARARYAAMFRQLARAQVGLTFPSIAPTGSPQRGSSRSTLEGSVVWIGDVPSASGDTAGARLRLPTRDVSRGDDAPVASVMGTASDVAVTAGVGKIRSFGTLDHERLTIAANLPGDLDVRGAGVVEVIVKARQAIPHVAGTSPADRRG